MACAVFLDPRFKLKLFEYYYPKFYDSVAAQEEMHKAILCLNMLYQDYVGKCNFCSRVNLSGNVVSNFNWEAIKKIRVNILLKVVH